MSKSTFVDSGNIVYPTVHEVQREYIATYMVLDPEAAAAMDLLEAGVAASRVAALYPPLSNLTQQFAALVRSEDSIAPFVKSMEHCGLGLIEHYGSSELLDEFFLMPNQLDFLLPEFRRLSYNSYPKHDYLALLAALSPLEITLTALADALWLGSNWERLAPKEDKMVGRELVKVLQSQRKALLALDAEALAAVS